MLPLVSGFSPSDFVMWEVGLTVAVSRNTRSVHTKWRSCSRSESGLRQSSSALYFSQCLHIAKDHCHS